MARWTDPIPHCPHHAGRKTIRPGLYGCFSCDWQREGPVVEGDD